MRMEALLSDIFSVTEQFAISVMGNAISRTRLFKNIAFYYKITPPLCRSSMLIFKLSAALARTISCERMDLWKLSNPENSPEYTLIVNLIWIVKN